MSLNLVTMLADEVAQFIRPLSAIKVSMDPQRDLQRFLAEAGWRPVATIDLEELTDTVVDAVAVIESLIADPVPDNFQEAVARIDQVADVVAEIENLVDAVASFGSPGPVAAAEVAALLEDLLHHLIVSWIGNKGPLVPAFEVLGLIEHVDVEAVAMGWLARPERSQRRFRIATVPLLLADPFGYISDRLAPDGWVDPVAVTRIVATVSFVLGPMLRRRGGIWDIDPYVLDIRKRAEVRGRDLGMRLQLPATENGPATTFEALARFVAQGEQFASGSSGPGVELSPRGGLSQSFGVGSGALDIGVDVGSAPDGAAIEIGPHGVVGAPTAQITGSFLLDVPTDLVLGVNRTGLTLGELQFGMTASAGTTGTELSFFVAAMNSTIGIDTADFGEGISNLIPAAAEIPFDLGLEWLMGESVRLIGSASLDFTVVRELSFGDAFSIHDLRLSVGLGDSLSLAVLGDLLFSFGPVDAIIGGIGVQLALDTSAAGNIGGADLAIAFTPPTSLGLALDLGVAAGGGYLLIDAEAGLYEGVIGIKVLSIGISAFVLIETKRPDIDGWSMLAALFIELPAIQLGFGFALTGVGGIAGINRSIDAEALGSAVRSGSLDTVLFPDDPVADAPIIFDTLGSMFPPADGQYVFGPIVRIGWGTPELVSVSVGIVIELPDPVRIAIIGSVEAMLPEPRLALVEIHLDVAGIIDFGAGTIAIDASLHNSKIVGFNLAGDMALRAGFKGSPEFLLSLGGFHPDFEPPAGFPSLQRLSIGLDAGPFFRVSFECYMAITSNTVQFGAAFEIVAKISGFGIEGGTEFDALIQFNPFKLKTSMGLHIAVTAWKVDLMGVWLSGSLEGPNPWHFTGQAKFKVLGANKEVNVDEIIGSRNNEITASPPNLLGLIVEALESADAWAAAQTDAVGVNVTEPEDDGEILTLGPNGSIEIGQNIAPLNQPLEKFGNVENLNHNEFRLVPTGDEAATGIVQDWFAPGHYTHLKNKARLSAPSFEKMQAGIAFGSGESAGPARMAQLEHEKILLDPDLEEAFEYESDRFITGGYRSIEDAWIMKNVVVTADSTTSFADVIPVYDYLLEEPSYEVVDALTGELVSPPSSYLAASQAAGDGHVITYSGEVRR